MARSLNVSDIAAFILSPKVALLQERIGYHFQNKYLLTEALIHSSSKVLRGEIVDIFDAQIQNDNVGTLSEYQKLEQSPFKTQSSLETQPCSSKISDLYISQQRLEFLGDAVLKLAIANYTYKMYPDFDEGLLSRICSNLLCTKTLAAVAKSIDLGDCIITGAKDEVSNHITVLENSMEALLGAIHLDASFQEAEIVILRLWREFLTQKNVEILMRRDSKSLLQEITQKRYRKLPEYKVLEASTASIASFFRIRASIFNESAVGEGTSKKAAELDAASKLIALLEL